MRSFVKIGMTNLFKSLVAVSTFVRVAAGKNFTFIRLLDSPWADQGFGLFSLLLLVIKLRKVFARQPRFFRLDSCFAVIRFIGDEKIFLIVEEIITKADQLCFVRTKSFVVRQRYVLVDLGLAENRAFVVVLFCFVRNFIFLVEDSRD